MTGRAHRVAVLGDGAASETLAPRDAADVREIVARAAAGRTPLRIRGGGSWLDAGRSVAAAHRLDLSALRGIVEYTPGDLTLTALAATPLADIEAATRANGQWLALDPAGGDASTLGATLATASYGALAGSFGHPRDVALGVEFVSGRGVMVHGGGRVVKNVAGFDLVRLTVGAWGTLGVITQATVRLRALPDVDHTVALDASRSLAELLRALRDAPLAAPAVELLSSPLAARLGAGDGDVVLVRLMGNEEHVAAQRAVLAAMAAVRDVDGAVWERLRRATKPDASSFRVSRRPSELASVWMAMRTAAASAPGVLLHGTVERGVVRCVAPNADEDALRELWGRAAGAGTRIAERLPDALWADVPDAAGDRLSLGVRDAFDPAAILNPGILGGERGAAMAGAGGTTLGGSDARDGAGAGAADGNGNGAAHANGVRGAGGAQ